MRIASQREVHDQRAAGGSVRETEALAHHLGRAPGANQVTGTVASVESGVEYGCVDHGFRGPPLHQRYPGAVPHLELAVRGGRLLRALDAFVQFLAGRVGERRAVDDEVLQQGREGALEESAGRTLLSSWRDASGSVARSTTKFLSNDAKVPWRKAPAATFSSAATALAAAAIFVYGSVLTLEKSGASLG